MAKTVFYLFFAFFVLIANHSSSQIIDCEATLKAWQNDPKWRDYAKNCTCVGVPPGQGPRCTPIGNISPFGGKTHQQIQKQIFQGLFQPMINAIFSDLFTPSNLIPNKQQEFIKDQHEEELKKHQEIAKKKAWEEWLRAQTEAEVERVREETERKGGYKVVMRSDKLEEPEKILKIDNWWEK